MTEQEAVMDHFFEDRDGREVRIEELDSGNKKDYVTYLLENEKLDSLEPVNGNMLRTPDRPDIEMPQEKKAIEKAEEVIDSEDTYWVLRGQEGGVVGHALNEEEGGAAEMRIIIDNEDYRGLRSDEGDSLYDVINDIRISSAEGTPYVFNTSRKAQYKIENTEYDDREFKVLKWGSNFKGFEDEGVLMALEEPEGEAPEEIYLPEIEDNDSYIDWNGVESMIRERLEEFNDQVETDFRRDYGFDDFESQRDLGLGLEVVDSPSGNRCYVVNDEGGKKPDEVIEGLQEERERADYVIEARVDLETPQGVDVVDELVGDGWLVSGFVPDIGGSYDSNELSLVYPQETVDFYATEAIEDFFDQIKLPYRASSGSLEEEKSVDVQVGSMPRSFSEEEIPYSNI